jgi:hypothetical protein
MFKLSLRVLLLTLALTTVAKADDTLALRMLLANAATTGSDAVIGPGNFSIQPQGDDGPMLPVTANIAVRCAAGTVLRVADHTLVGGCMEWFSPATRPKANRLVACGHRRLHH